MIIMMVIMMWNDPQVEIQTVLGQSTVPDLKRVILGDGNSYSRHSTGI